jgi:hypothetical protein
MSGVQRELWQVLQGSGEVREVHQRQGELRQLQGLRPKNEVICCKKSPAN